MAINLTDSLNAATTKGKLGEAKQIFLNGDTKNLQQAHEETNTHLDTLDNRSTQMENAIKDISVTGGASVASAVSYDNSASGLEAVNAQGALDEIKSWLSKVNYVRITQSSIASESNIIDLSDPMFMGTIRTVSGSKDYIQNKPSDLIGSSFIVITSGIYNSGMITGGSHQILFDRITNNIWVRVAWGSPATYSSWVKLHGTDSIATEHIQDGAVTDNKISSSYLKRLCGIVNKDNIIASESNIVDLNSREFQGTLSIISVSSSNIQYILNAPSGITQSLVLLTTGAYDIDRDDLPSAVNGGVLQFAYERITNNIWVRVAWGSPATYSSWVKLHSKDSIATEHIQDGAVTESKLADGVLGKKSELTNYCFPTHIFSSINSVALANIAAHESEVRARNYVNTLYADRLYKDSDAVFNGKKATQILSDNNRWKYSLDKVSTTRIALTLGSDKIKDTNISFNLITTKNEVAVGKIITCMSIGDSITANDLAFWDEKGKHLSSWGYWSFVHSLFSMDNVDYNIQNSTSGDNIKYISIGTIYRPYYSFEYRGETIQNKDYGEGRSGWSLSSYLRHPINTQGNSEGFYDILGLKTAKGKWTGTTEQKYLIGSTCWGEYYPDITEASWNLFRSKIGLSTVSFTDATEEQKQKLLTWATTTIVENPDNPFFGGIIETDSTTGRKYTFSWNSYYSRYKTHEDDGVTELSVKGTKYKENSLVCTPKFISICLGTNDSHLLSNEDILSDLNIMATTLKESTSAKILIIKNADSLSQIPQYFKNISQFTPYIPSRHYDIHKLLKEYYGSLKSQEANGIFYMPTFFIQGYGTSADHRVESWNGESEYNYTICNGDIHPGVFGHKQIGYQMYSMILYLLSVED